jgi:4-hydroxy-3-methylbut-2-enyl diphosphate reductase
MLAQLMATGQTPIYLLSSTADQGIAQFRLPPTDVRVVDQLADVPDGAAVAFPVHGVDPQTRATAALRGLRVVDMTCPLVARTQVTARRFADEGRTVAVIGGPGHAAVRPIVGQAPESIVVIDTVEDVDRLAVDDPARVSFVVSPGLAVEDATVIVARLRARFTRPLGQHPNDFCYAASDRQAAVRDVVANSDVTLVLGDPVVEDTCSLVNAAIAQGGVVEQVADVGGLRPDWIGPAATVGLAVGTSARPGLVEEFIEVLSGLGPLSVAHHRVTTEVQQQVQQQVPPPVRVGSTGVRWRPAGSDSQGRHVPA